MAPSKPTVIFVPGAWHGPEAFGNVQKQLEGHDYPTVGISLPSVGAQPPLKSWEKDVDTIQIAVKDVADKGGDVVLVMHSYGGLPSGEAAKGFVKMQRERDGMKGGIVRLVYLCSLVLPEDASLMGPMNNEKAPWVEIDGDSIRLTDPTTAANTFYNDLDQATADYWASRLTHHSYPTFHCKVTYAAWRDIPSTYLYCEADNAIPLSMQEMMVQDAGGFQTERCSAGHSPFLSQPELVVDVIRRAAGETV